MSKDDLERANIEDFFYWINERHNIYLRRFEQKLKKPWTEDKILQRWKFTNVFRQLDRGTIALNNMLGEWHNSLVPFREMDAEDAIDVLFNIVWYRLFNFDEHAENMGFMSHKDHDILRQYLLNRREEGLKVFTGAHMTSGGGKIGELHGKIYAHLVAAIGIAEEFGEELLVYILHNQTMLSSLKYHVF